jgi:DNA mismatch repair protein MutL
MVHRIQLLPQVLINKIAAGEVIVRPASVVKELIENSIDARATQISITVENQGRDITVSDNGEGIAPDDIELAIQRHSTSKIARYEDIQSLETRGFRGEALASIAAVSHLELISRTPDSLHGVRLRAEGGKNPELTKLGAPVGTSVSIRSLFFNTPARLKFLKSPTSEQNHVVQAITRQALAHPEIGFSFSLNEKRMIELPAGQQLGARIVQLLASTLEDHLIEVRLEGFPVRVFGYIVKPERARRDRRHQYFLVNSRPVTHRGLSYALDEAYKGLLTTQHYPVAVLFLRVNPADVDVNVHPTKEEVRFRDERMVVGLLNRAVVEALRGANLMAQVRLPQQPLTQEQRRREGVVGVFLSPDEMLRQQMGKPAQETLKGQTTLPLEPATSQPPFMPQPLATEPRIETPLPPSEPSAPQATPTLEDSLVARGYAPHPIGQIANTYILAELGEDLLLIDQHAAHERILYLRLQQRQFQSAAQSLLIPLTVEVSLSDLGYVEMLLPHLRELGIEIEHFGGNTFVIRSLPTDFDNIDAVALVHDLVDDLEQLGKECEIEVLRDRILTRMACHAAIKSGQALQPEEMRQLVAQIYSSHLSFTCPHGRPTMMLLTKDQLDKQFKRK